jgi:hypothetical protein
MEFLSSGYQPSKNLRAHKVTNYRLYVLHLSTLYKSVSKPFQILSFRSLIRRPLLLTMSINGHIFSVNDSYFVQTKSLLSISKLLNVFF